MATRQRRPLRPKVMVVPSDPSGKPQFVSSRSQQKTTLRAAHRPNASALEATDANWRRLGTDRFRRAWQLAALSLGWRPVRSLVRELRSAGLDDAATAYVGLLNTITNNLTDRDDPVRLRYELGSENDGRALDPSAAATERVVDVVRFVHFAKQRKLKIDPQMEQIALSYERADRPESQGKAETLNADGSPTIAPADHEEPPQFQVPRVDPPEAAPTPSAIRSPTDKTTVRVLGLLAVYVAQLARTGKAPPKELIRGSSLSASALAQVLTEYTRDRTDLKSKGAMEGAGLSETTVRKAIGVAATAFANSISAD